jgi:DNA adenine methylase
MAHCADPAPRPFLKWVGGKRQLLPELLRAVASAGRFRRYHEPFVGGGALFFALAGRGLLPARCYLADANPNLIDTYRAVRDEVDAVIAILHRHRRRHSEAYFYRVRAERPSSLAERAARIIYLNRTCYNGLYRENRRGQFNAPFGRYQNPTICDEENLRAASATLAHAELAVQDFAAVLRQARRGDLVYFDPPYHPLSTTARFTAYSRGGFGVDAQQRLAEVFAQLVRRGVKVILSNSMTDFTRGLYAGYPTREVLAARMVNSRADRRGKVSEALITSFPLDPGGAVPPGRPAPARGADRPARAAGAGVAAPAKPGRNLERTAAATPGPGLVRRWLLQNQYPEVAALIDQVTAEWAARGKRTRRNWWEVLAGDARGGPRTVGGREFPVLRAAQLRQGVPVTADALCRTPGEAIPVGRRSGRRSR